MNSLASCHFILAPVEIGAQLRALEKGYGDGDGRDGDVSKKIFVIFGCLAVACRITSVTVTAI